MLSTSENSKNPQALEALAWGLGLGAQGPPQELCGGGQLRHEHGKRPNLPLQDSAGFSGVWELQGGLGVLGGVGGLFVGV